MSTGAHVHDRMFDRSGALPAPSWRDLIDETRAVLRAHLNPRRPHVGPVPPGDGHPVIVLPALFCSDAMTRSLRAWLNALGYAVEGWGSGLNLGPNAATIAMVDRLLRQSTVRAGRKASLVGVSAGGVLARALANAHPDQVRRVITVCSPFRLPTATPLEPLFRALAPLHSGEEALIARLTAPPPVPTTAIYSPRDGVVAWRSCVDEPGPGRENFAIDGPHTTMLHNPQTLRVIAERLVLP
jgi:hypothetical protein